MLKLHLETNQEITITILKKVFIFPISLTQEKKTSTPTAGRGLAKSVSARRPRRVLHRLNILKDINFAIIIQMCTKYYPAIVFTQFKIFNPNKKKKNELKHRDVYCTAE